MTKFFQNLFKKPEYKWLNPNATNGVGSGKGSGSGKNGDSGKKIRSEDEKSNSNNVNEKSDEKNTEESKKKKHGGSGLDIELIDWYNKPLDGILNPETNNFQCNKQHPLYRKYKNNKEALNQRIKSILFSELVKHGAKRQKTTAEQVLVTHRDLMTEAKDLKLVD